MSQDWTPRTAEEVLSAYKLYQNRLGQLLKEASDLYAWWNFLRPWRIHQVRRLLKEIDSLDSRCRGLVWMLGVDNGWGEGWWTS